MTRDYVADNGGTSPILERLNRTIRTIIRAATYVEESVEDGVAEGGIADDLVPVLDGDLAGQQRAAAGVAVVEDLEDVVASLG